MMRRREWLARIGAAAVAGVAVGPRRSVGQAGADPLRMPGAVQQRTVVTDSQNDETVKAIEHRLKCTCGCNLDVFTCRTTDFTCGTSPEMHREVVTLLEAGNSPDQVVAAFVTKYGEEVLMAPKPEGFNIAGYIVPGLALTLAGGILAAVLVRRHRVAAVTMAPDGAAAVPLGELPAGTSAAEMARLEQALQEVNR
ncbi:MAG: cytochrome c-type biogenesis protein CcmH [Gemmatimonadota bacterium]|nr:cytochrome c-type biogenesis protein CcmH [Gemmatimonadota bacterium]